MEIDECNLLEDTDETGFCGANQVKNNTVNQNILLSNKGSLKTIDKLQFQVSLDVNTSIRSLPEVRKSIYEAFMRIDSPNKKTDISLRSRLKSTCSTTKSVSALQKRYNKKLSTHIPNKSQASV
jgi:wobble nucleotide-excising tRNase